MKKLRLPALLLALLLLIGACSAAMASESYSGYFLTALDKSQIQSFMESGSGDTRAMLACLLVLDYFRASEKSASIVNFDANMYVGQYGTSNNIDLFVRKADDTGYMNLCYYPLDNSLSVYNFTYTEEALESKFQTDSNYSRNYSRITPAMFASAMDLVTEALGA